MTPASAPTPRALYDAARSHVVAVDREDRGRLLVSGRDRASFLHALFTNDIAALQPGQGCYTAYLTPQGRMIADFQVHELGDAILLVTDRSIKDAMLERLGQLVFAEDVRIADATGTFHAVALVGPEGADAAAAIVSGLTGSDLRALSEHGSRHASFAGDPAIVRRIADTGEPGYEILVAAAHREALDRALSARGVPRAGAGLVETLRIEAGIPKFLQDMDQETIPLEAGIESRAISMTKGCYVGQEVIVRVLHRGHGRVAEKLVGLTLEGAEPPAPGAEVVAEGRKVGRITSSTVSPALGRPIALAYLHRDFVAPGTHVDVDGMRAVVRGLGILTAAV